MRKLNVVTVLATALVLGALPSADAKLAKNGDASVGFVGIGPAGMKISGTTSDLSVADDGKTITISVPLKNLTTGISLRDKHMREKYLQIDQFPNAELAVDRGTLRFPSSGEVSGDAKGTMKLHGKTKQVDVHYTAKKDGAAIKVTGSSKINMNDYGIVIPTYLGVTMKPDVDLSVSFAANE